MPPNSYQEHRPPLDDIWFALEDIVDLAALAKLPSFQHADPELVAGVLDEAGRFVAEVVAPLNRLGDEQHSRRNGDGTVTTPDGFADAYQRYVAAGWGSVPFPAEYGGGGFPWLVATVLGELLAQANLAFALCPTPHARGDRAPPRPRRRAPAGALPPPTRDGRVDRDHEPDGARRRLGPRRHPDQGVPSGDGTWRISGQKIFITYGDHLAENIVHLVLARVPDAGPGTRGISCFIVPKRLVDDTGTLGPHNRVQCLSIEAKLGIHASPMSRWSSTRPRGTSSASRTRACATCSR
jgi:alkylation response protein AidB-like acyl-CoA dehydrogenase